MVFQALFRRWRSRSNWSHRRPVRRLRAGRPRRRLTFPTGTETLEVRQLLSNIAWNTDASGFWDDPTNWLTSEGQQRVPESGDTVTIDRGIANPTITVRFDQQVASIVSTEAIVISAGTLRSGGGGEAAGAVLLAGGALQTESNTPFLLSGTTTLQSGALVGGGIFLNQGTLVASGSADKTISSKFTNTATGRLQQAGTGTLFLGGTFTNQAGGLFEFQSDGDVAGTGRFDNFGTVRKSAGAGESAIAAVSGQDFSFHHLAGSAIESQSGTLLLQELRGDSTGAQLNAASSAVVRLIAHPGFSTYSGAYTGSGGGRVEFAGGLFRTGDGGATLNFPDGLLAWTGGTLSGSLARPLDNLGFMTLDGAGGKNVSDFVRNSGTMAVSGDGVWSINGRFDNAVTGLVDFRSDADLLGSGTFNNSGTLRKSGGTLESSLSAAPNGDLDFQHLAGSTVEAQSGVLFLDGLRGSSTGATWNAGQNGILRIVGQQNGFVSYSGTYSGSGAGRVEYAGGSINSGGAGATFDFPAGLFHITAGNMSGGGNRPFRNEGFITVSGAAAKSLSDTFMNSGTLQLEGGGDLTLNGTFNNLADGIVDFRGDGRILGNGTVHNSGMVKKSAGAGTSTFAAAPNSDLYFRHLAGSVIQADSGILLLDGLRGDSTGAAWNAGANGILRLIGHRDGFVSYAGTYTGSGDGRVEYAGGTIQAGDAGATLDFAEGLFHWTGGGMIGSGPAPLINAGFIQLSGTEAKGIANQFINRGTIIQDGQGDFHLNAGLFMNDIGAVFEMQGDSELYGTDQFGNAGQFRNAGRLTKTDGAGTVNVTARINNLATGTIEVNEGAIEFQRGSDSSGGEFNVSVGAKLLFSGNDGFTWSGRYTGSGGGVIESSGLLIGSESSSAFLDFEDVHFKVVGGQLLGSLVNDGTIDFAAAAGIFTRAGIINNGTWLHTGTGDFVLNANSRFFNNGLYDLKTDADFVVPGDASGGSMYFVNQPAGVLRKSGGTGTTSFRHDGFGKELQFDNTGAVEVLSGTMEFIDPVVQFSSATLTAGTWVVGPFATLSAPNSPNLTTNRGRVVLSGDTSSFPKINTLANNQGEFTLQGGRDFTTAGNLVNSGLLDVGPGSVLTVTGALSQSAQSSLVGWWRGDSNANDSAASINGTLQGDAAYGAGHSGEAFDLDGNGDFVTLGNPAALHLQDFTISAWVKRSSLTQGGLIFGYGFGGYTLGMFDDGKLLVSNVGISHVGTSALAITDDAFHHVAVSKSGNTVTFYVDGVAETTGPYVTTFSFGTNAAIGARADNGTGSFAGRIDEVAVFNRPLSADDVRALRTSGNPVALGSRLPTVQLHVAGRPSTGQFGKLVVGGAATLSGRLNIETQTGFLPPSGDAYEPLRFASRTGDFTQTTGVTSIYAVDVQATRILLTSIATPPVDLVVAAVSAAPSTGNPGDSITVTYTVQNLNDAALSTSWIDSIYLSNDTSFSPDDILFTRVTHAGGVAALDDYMESVTAQLPGVLNGPYYFVVVANSRGQAAESNRLNNNGSSSTPIDVSIPTMTLGTPVTSSIAAGQDRYYRIDVPATGDVSLEALFHVARQAELFVRRGSLPTRSVYDATAANLLELQRDLLVESPQPGPLYVLVHGRDGAGAGVPFTLTAEHVVFDLRSVSPAEGTNGGEATVTLEGSGFSSSAVVTLFSDAGLAVRTATIKLDSANRLYATFDLTGLAVGNYDVQLSDVGGSETLADSFTVRPASTSKLRVDVLMPGRVRGGSTFTAYIEYINESGADLVAPMIYVSSPTSSRFQIASFREEFSENVRFLAVSHQGIPGILRAGERIRVPIRVQASEFVNEIQTSISYVSNTAAMDWNSLKKQLIDEIGSVANFEAVFTELVAQNGPTVGDYVAMLARNANLITPPFGDARDPVDLLKLEFRRVQAKLGTSLSGHITTTNFAAKTRGVQVFASNLDTGLQYSTYSLSDGSFVFEKLTAGHYEFAVEGAVVSATVPGTVQVEDGQALTDVTIHVEDAFTFSGLVTDSNGVAVPLATIAVYRDGVPVDQTVADTTGRYAIHGVAAGEYDFIINADGFARSTRDDVLITADATNVNLTLREAARLSATVRLDGVLADSALVFASRPGNVLVSRFGSISDANGQVLLDLPADTYDLFVTQGEAYVKLTGVTVSEGTTLNLGTIELVSPPEPIGPALRMADPVAAARRTYSPELEQAFQDSRNFIYATWMFAAEKWYGPTVRHLWELYMRGSSESRPERQFFSDGSDIIEGHLAAAGFRNSGSFRDKANENFPLLREAILSELKAKLRTGEIDCDDLNDIGVMVFDLQDFKTVNRNLDVDVEFGNIDEIPGNLAGGIGDAQRPYDQSVGQASPDRRYITGLVTVRPQGKDSVKVEFSVKVTVEDTIDFIPGNPGKSVEQVITSHMTLLERFDRAYDVPFTASWYLQDSTWFQDAVLELPPEEDDLCDEDEEDDGEDGGRSSTGVQVSADPNEKLTVGAADPNGDPNRRFILGDTTLAYQVSYENVPTAEAPAQRVTITDVLDPNVDLATFELGEFNFGDFTISVPAGRKSYEVRVDATETLGCFVDFKAALDESTRTITWTLTAIDPTTGDVNESDPEFGFLPPNNSNGDGQGYVTYTIRPVAGLADDVAISNQASIVFDFNAPIITNTVVNVIDLVAPQSAATPLPQFSATTFTVQWTGQDGAIGSGVSFYDVFVSVDGGVWAPFVTGTSATSATFTGQAGHTYSFYAVAVDGVGHRELKSPVVEATTTIAYDFGDAPDTYGTTLASNGPSHLSGSLFLGTTVDLEGDGQPATAADGDGDDEDGVTLPAVLAAGLTARIPVVASASGYLDAWIDFNRNGQFDVNEQIADSVPVVAGVNTLSIVIPTSVVGGQSYARFRISSAGNLNPTGAAADGEVEDYAVELLAATPGTARLVDDPARPGEQILVVYGSSGKDAISVGAKSKSTGRVTITMNKRTIGQFAGSGRIAVFGLEGDDRIAVSASSGYFAVLRGGAGKDTLTAGALGSELYGEEGNDLLYGGIGSDLLDGGDGNDLLNGGNGDDTLFGRDGDDTLNGGNGNDTLFGGSGKDRLSGGAGNNVMLGEAGDDTLTGGSGRDVLIGGLGFDVVNGGSGDDLLIGGTTSFDHDEVALNEIRSAWTTLVNYQTRIAQLRNGANASGRRLLKDLTVFADGAPDRLTGSKQADWFFEFGPAEDTVLDRASDETSN